MRKVLFEEQTIDRHMMTFNSSERSYDLWSKVLYLSEVLYLRKRSYIDDAQFTRSILQYVYTHTHSDEISWSYSNSNNCTEWYFHVLSLCFSDHLWMVLSAQTYRWMEWDGMECDGRKSINPRSAICHSMDCCAKNENVWQKFDLCVSHGQI